MQDLMPPINTQDKIFHDGDPTTGQLGTIVTALWLNNVQAATRDVQAEIKSVLAKAGMTPDPKKTNQLADAISQIVTSGNYASTAYVDNGLNKKIDKANISGVKGNDNDKVPSLNLFTTETGKLATKAELSAGLAGKQPAGNYATTEALNDGLSKKFDKAGGELDGAITASWAVKAVTGNDKSNSVEFNFVQKVPILRITKDGSPFDLYLPSQAGRLMRVDEYGIGGTSSSKDANTIESTEFTASDSDSLNFFATFAPALSMKRPGGSDGTGFITQIQGDAKTRIAFRQRERGGWRGWYEFYTEANTSKDANGFLRQGSATALITNNVAQNTGTSTANVMSQKAVTDAIAGIKTLGDGQRWNDVKSQRQSGVAYTNSTGRTIALSVSTVGAQASSSVSIYVDNVLCSYNLFGGNSNADFTRHSIGYAIIPAGSTYRVDASSINTWAELR